MNFLTKLFKKKPVVEIPPMPSWETDELLKEIKTEPEYKQYF